MNAPVITFSDDQAEAWDNVASALRQAGVDTVICVAHGDPVEVFSWAAAAGADGSGGV